MDEIKTNQDSVSQSSYSNQPNSSITPKNNTYKYLFFVAIIILLSVIIAFYFVLNNKINQLSNKQTVDTTTTTTQKINTSIKISPTSIPTITFTESKLVQKDANNNLYINNKFGFSLVVPKLATGSIECKKGPDSYIPTYGLVPIAFFENDDTIYLAANNFYRVTDDRSTEDNPNNPGICEKLKTTFDLIEKDRVSGGNISSLKIYATNIKNDNELESYFKSKYGSGCRLGKKTLSEIPDVYTVEISSDGNDLDESNCPINFALVTKYNPIKRKLVIFELGQACNLDKGQSIGSGCNDQEIMKSFKFL